MSRNVKPWIRYLIGFALYLLIGFIFYYGILTVFGVIIDQFVSLAHSLPIIISSFLCVCLSLTLFYKETVKKIDRPILISLSLLATTAIMACILLLIFYSDYYFGSYVSVTRPIVTIFTILFCITEDIFLVLKRKDDGLPFGSSNLLADWRFVLFGLFTCFGLFFLPDVLMNLFIKSSWDQNPVVYLTLILLLLLPTLNTFYLLFRKPKGSRVLPLLCYNYNLLGFILILVYTFGHLTLPELCQNLFYLDYAASIAISPIALSVINVVMMVVSAIDIWLSIKYNPAKTVTEKETDTK